MKNILLDRFASLKALQNKHTAISKKLALCEKNSESFNNRSAELESVRRQILKLSPTAENKYEPSYFDNKEIYTIRDFMEQSILTDHGEGLLQEPIDQITDFDDMFEKVQVPSIKIIGYKSIDIEDENGNVVKEKIPLLEETTQELVVLKENGASGALVARFKRGIQSIANSLEKDNFATTSIEPAEIDPAELQETISKFLQTNNGSNLVLSILARNHYENITNKYIQDFENLHVKVENGKQIPLDDVGNRMLIKINALDTKTNGLVQKTLWKGVCDKGIEALSNKFREQSSYYNSNALGNIDDINESFITDLENCMKLASSEIVVHNQNIPKDLCYFVLPQNPYAPKQKAFDPTAIFQDKTFMANTLLSGQNPNQAFDAMNNQNKVLTLEEQAQVIYNLQNQVQSNPSLVNRDPNNAAYIPPNNLSNIDNSFQQLESNNNLGLMPPNEEVEFKF
jgi:hypothetical protein